MHRGKTAMTNEPPITPGRDSYIPVIGFHTGETDMNTTRFETETQITTLTYDPEDGTEHDITHDVDRRIKPGGPGGTIGPSPSL